MHTWLVNEHTTCAPGEEAAFIFGTSDKDTHILYEIYTADNKCTERKLIRLSDENRTFRIPFKETDGEGFTVSFTFVKDGKMYVKQIPVQRRYREIQRSTPATGSEIEYPGKDIP